MGSFPSRNDHLLTGLIDGIDGVARTGGTGALDPDSFGFGTDSALSAWASSLSVTTGISGWSIAVFGLVTSKSLADPI